MELGTASEQERPRAESLKLSSFPAVGVSRSSLTREYEVPVARSRSVTSSDQPSPVKLLLIYLTFSFDIVVYKP
jgi:hypothetical protein